MDEVNKKLNALWSTFGVLSIGKASGTPFGVDKYVRTAEKGGEDSLRLML